MTHRDTPRTRRSFDHILGVGTAAAGALPAPDPPDAGARRVWRRADQLFLVGTKVIDMAFRSLFGMLLAPPPNRSILSW